MATTALIWTTAFDARGIPVARFNYKESRIASSDISVGEEKVVQRGPEDIILSAPRSTVKKLDELHTLPNLVRCPLVDQTLQDIIARFVGPEVQFLPVTVRAKDGDVFRFSYAKPLVGRPCVDLEKSEIERWIIPGEAIADARLLVFKPDCLGDKHLARDTYTDHIVVSEQLKDALLATKDKALRFVTPENVWNRYGPRVLH